MIVTIRVLIITALLLPLASGCSTRQMAVREMAGILDTGMSAFENDDDLEMLAQAFPANIKLVEALLANDPGNADLKIMLSRLYASYSFAFLEPLIDIDYFGLEDDVVLPFAGNEQDPAQARPRALRYYRKGEGFAFEALSQRFPDAEERLKTPEGQSALFAEMTPGDVPALFWWAFNLGARINLERSSVALLAKASMVEKAMLTVAALDPGYQHGGAHLFLLAYYGSRPPMMGGKPQAARYHFDALMQRAGSDFLLGTVYNGRYVLQPAQTVKDSRMP